MAFTQETHAGDDMSGGVCVVVDGGGSGVVDGEGSGVGDGEGSAVVDGGAGVSVVLVVAKLSQSIPHCWQLVSALH